MLTSDHGLWSRHDSESMRYRLPRGSGTETRFVLFLSAIAKGVYFAPRADHLPTKSVKKKEDLTIDGVKLQLRHWAPANTSGDLVVLVPAEGIVFADDLLTEHSYPLIHMECLPQLWILPTALAQNWRSQESAL